MNKEKAENNDYDLCDTLCEDKRVKKGFATWRNIFFWAYGLLNTTSEQIADLEEAKEALNE